MSDGDGAMTAEDFRRHDATVLADVCAILDGTTKIRKRLRLPDGAVYERDSGRLVAEILRTTVGPVVYHRFAAIEGSDLEQPERTDLRTFRREHAVAPLTGDPAQTFMLKGDQAVYVMFGANIAARSYPGNTLVFR